MLRSPLLLPPPNSIQISKSHCFFGRGGNGSARAAILYVQAPPNIHGDGMLFLGFEKGADGAGYVQEWRVMVG